MRLKGLWVATLLLLASLFATAQESAVKGNLSGTVYDSTGAVVPGAKVTLSGPTGTRDVDADNEGRFLFPLLTPGFYSVRVEKQGFKASEVKGIEIATNKTSAIRVSIEPGAVTEVVEVSAPAVTVDTSSTAVGANLTDSFYSQVPVQRNVSGLFYVAPGAVSGGGTGVANPSISGGSGLENQYVADGVNITDGAFGGLGVFSRVYGSLTTGINLAFVQEVQVKSGGYEPQYGKSTGGIVQIVTKSGGSSYHGTIGAFFAPQGLEAERFNSDLGGDDPSLARFNQQGLINHQGGYDVDGEIGGFVPGFKNNLFFFGSFNPSWARDYGTFAALHGLQATPGAPLGGLGNTTIKSTAYNYAAKLTWKINANHTLEGSVFGDPTRTPSQPGTTGSAFLNTNSATTFDKLSYGTRNAVVRYNGTFSPTWLVNASVSWGHNYITDTPLNPDIFGIVNNIGSTAVADINGNGVTLGAVNPNPAGCPVTAACLSTGGYTMQGYGFLENTEGDNYGFEIDTQKSFHFLGDHTFSLGYKLDRNFYDGSRFRTGGFVPVPTTDAFGDPVDFGGAAAAAAVAASPFGMDAGLQLRVTTNPAFPLFPMPDGSLPHVRLLQTRGEFGNPAFNTAGTYHSIYGMDSWSPLKYITINAGLRWEQQYVQGTFNPTAGSTSNYTWVGNWSPRIGVVVDPWGDRKTKVYVNFGRYNYAIPLDMAIRSLSNEEDVLSFQFTPHWVGEPAGGGPCVAAGGTCSALVAFNPDGTLVNPTLDAAHLLNTTPFIGLSSTESIAPGTKMESLDEWVVGFERDFGHGVIFSARYVDRRMKRIVEDMSGISPEAANLGVTQNFLIANPSPKTDLFINPIQVTGWTPTFDATGAITNTPAQCIGFEGAPGAPGTGTPIFTGQAFNTFNQAVTPGGTPAADGVTNTGVCVVPQFSNTGAPNYPGGAAPGDLGSDGIPEGFVQPIRNYQAMEFEVNKSFSKNWQLRSNWRISRLKGNYEGAFRNDNGQSDPSISSLFDFTAGEFALLGDQFAVGYLNTDRRHVVNTYFSYVFDKSHLKGLTIGTGVRVQTGQPINDLKAHPVYLNAGEVPVNGRGSLGRFPTTGQVDVHADYAFNVTEKSKVRFGVDLFNIANMKRVTNIDQNEDRSFGVPNADFQRITGIYSGFQRPFFARLMAKWEF